jgi:hypothetical protein
MSDKETTGQETTEQPAAVKPETTNAYRAGYMAGYVADNPNADPSVAGYMDGYFEQREGSSKEPDAE